MRQAGMWSLLKHQGICERIPRQKSKDLHYVQRIEYRTKKDKVKLNEEYGDVCYHNKKSTSKKDMIEYQLIL